MERNPFRHATGVTPPPQGEASSASKKHKIKRRTRVERALGGTRGQRPLEKLYIVLKIEIPLPHQRGALLPKSACVGGGKGVGTSQVALCATYSVKKPWQVFCARVILAHARLTRQEPLGSLQNPYFIPAKPRFL